MRGKDIDEREFEEATDLSRYKLSSGVKMAMLDLDGLKPGTLPPLPKREEGEVIFEMNVAIDNSVPIAPNIDFNPDELTPEQKEVLEALEAADDYEPLEDDFVLMANDGEVPLTLASSEERIKAKDFKSHAKNTEEFMIEIPKVKGDGVSREEFLASVREDLAELKKEDKSEADLNLGELTVKKGDQKLVNNKLISVEKVDDLPGGGKIIFTKTKRLTAEELKARAAEMEKQYENENEEEEDEEEEDEEDEDEENEDEDNAPEFNENFWEGEASFSEEESPYIVDPNPLKPKLGLAEGELSVSEDETPLDGTELARLHAEYRQNKKEMLQGGRGGKKGNKAAEHQESENESEGSEESEQSEENEDESFEDPENKLVPLKKKKKAKVVYDPAKDPAIKALAERDEDSDVEIPMPAAPGKKFTARCPVAPKPTATNSYCIPVAPHEIDVKPVPKPPKPQRKVQEKAIKPETKAATILKVPKSETPEERKARKAALKELKSIQKETKKVQKAAFNEAKAIAVNEKNSTAHAAFKPGFSVYTISH